ncbi:AAA family ATPase [Promicromonospora sp. NPDC050249]|uniref:AAA family ATPase n=1 Tax=Promicromonospora sp. NPDC050249 TaxID=3154743 RepID=UPI0033D8F62B
MEPTYEPLLPGIALAGYRSFAEWQQILLPTKVTVLAGVNNSGKSNVLRIVQDVFPSLMGKRDSRGRAPNTWKMSELDTPRGFSTKPEFEIGIPSIVSKPTEASDQLVQSALQRGAAEDVCVSLMQILSDDDHLFWPHYEPGNPGTVIPTKRQVTAAIEAWPNWNSDFEQVRRALKVSGGVDPAEVMRALLGSIPIPVMPPVMTISGHRRVSGSGGNPDWGSGRGIIDALFKLQIPTHTDWQASESRWQTINRFVQTVLGDPDARLSIPHDKSAIQVVTSARVLPLSSLGSGVEQVVILAAAATVTSRTLVCIEEPETNLHPLLQKKLLRYLTDETDNQYLIATHSSHFLDDARATAYNLQLTEAGTQVSLARSPHDFVRICNDLGYRPSDLQQANCVIWVEGPSDRIYVRRWLELVDPKLAEGIDYSVMFYGGKLLAHLSTSEESFADFINLRRLNRFSMVLIDSDLSSHDKDIAATKQRIASEYLEVDSGPGFAWITNGYTIENYIPSDILTIAVQEVHSVAFQPPADKHANPLKNLNGKQFDKVAISHAVARLLAPAHLDVLDLKDSVEKLSKFVRSANGNSTAPASTL